MKRFLSILMVLCMLLSLAACGEKKEEEPQTSADLLETIKDRGYITIATEGAWSPWTYHDENDELVGYDVEIGKAIAEKLGVEAQFVETGWDSILAGVDSGRFDLACNGVGNTPDRAEKYNFSTPYAYISTVLVVNGDNTDITSFEDLAGKTTANTASSTYAQKAEGFGATNTPVDSLLETLELLINNRIDATLNAKVSINDYLREHPDANIKIIAETDPEIVCIPVRKSEESQTLLDEINRCLEEMREDGTLAELSVKYFGIDQTRNE